MRNWNVLNYVYVVSDADAYFPSEPVSIGRQEYHKDDGRIAESLGELIAGSTLQIRDTEENPYYWENSDTPAMITLISSAGVDQMPALMATTMPEGMEGMATIEVNGAEYDLTQSDFQGPCLYSPGYEHGKQSAVSRMLMSREPNGAGKYRLRHIMVTDEYCPVEELEDTRMVEPASEVRLVDWSTQAKARIDEITAVRNNFSAYAQGNINSRP